jgi:long-subunit fatty acid transport protein
MPSSRLVRLTLAAALTTGLAARASGFYFGDNGASAMVQGGAFTAQADDALGMQYNPAGLTQISGFHALADVNILRHDVTFLRQDSGFDPGNPSALINTVSSQKAPFLLPYFGAAYGFTLFGRRATVGLGLFAPPSQGRYEYPTPDYTTDAMGAYTQNPKKYAPQRYALLMTDILIAYPTLSLAYEVHPRVQLGVSAQLTVSHFKQTQVMYGGDVFCPPGMACGGEYNPQRQLLENPDYDAIVNIDLPGRVGATVIGGVMVRPTDWLAVGASIRPPIPFTAYGPFSVQLPKTFVDAGASVSGDRAMLQMTLPLELRVGARVTPFTSGALKDRLGINVDFLYQGWDSVKELLLTPDNVTLSSGSGSTPTPIAPFAVKKNWQPTWSVRVGASFRAHQYVSAHLGALYETGAAPEATYSVDWTHPSRFIFTGGVTGHLGPVNLIVGALFTPTNTTIVQNSEVLRGQTNPDIAAGAVGNGIYTSGGWGLITGLRLNLGGAPKSTAPIEPTPAPVPVPAAPTDSQPAAGASAS